MVKFYNTLSSPLRYSDDGKVADGHSWFESEETDQIKAAMNRKEVFKIDSKGEFVYDSSEDNEQNESATSDEPLTPENAGKKTPRKKLEG